MASVIKALKSDLQHRAAREEKDKKRREERAIKTAAHEARARKAAARKAAAREARELETAFCEAAAREAAANEADVTGNASSTAPVCGGQLSGMGKHITQAVRQSVQAHGSKAAVAWDGLGQLYSYTHIHTHAPARHVIASLCSFLYYQMGLLRRRRYCSIVQTLLTPPVPFARVLVSRCCG